MVYKKCGGCGKEMDLTVSEYHVVFNTIGSSEMDVCLDCVRTYFNEIPEQIDKVEVI